MKYRSLLFLTFLSTFTLTIVAAQQQGDTLFVPKNTHQTFTGESTPVVAIDEAHHNFHTKDSRYLPFAMVLESDGCTVRKNTEKFSAASLQSIDVLVVSNALHEKNVGNLGGSWDLPNYDAFDRSEIEAIYTWVKNGGSLLLIADHMPFPRAAEALAAIFGFQFNNGYARDKTNPRSVFSVENGQLIDHAIRRGKQPSETIDSIRTFTGQAFLPPPAAKPLLQFKSPAVSLMPAKSWDLQEDTPAISIDQWSQGATLEFGKGRIAVFGEAAMFTAQYAQGNWFGMKSKGAEQNEQFLLNVVHWLVSEQ